MLLLKGSKETDCVDADRSYTDEEWEPDCEGSEQEDNNIDNDNVDDDATCWEEASHGAE